jgi:hypothetical protein
MPLSAEPIPSTISGTVMMAGDSCGWTPSGQRLRVPTKVIIISRVM